MFGTSWSLNTENKNDTSLFVQKPYLKTNSVEADIEKYIDLKNRYRNKILRDPISIKDACAMNYADNLLKDPSIIKNNADISFSEKK